MVVGSGVDVLPAVAVVEAVEGEGELLDKRVVPRSSLYVESCPRTQSLIRRLWLRIGH